MHFEAVTIALTHLQAFYDEPGQHHEIRLRQLKTIEGALIGLIGEPEQSNAWDKVIVLGDLNIRGDRPPYSTEGYGEWGNVFMNNGGPCNNTTYGILFRQNRLIFTENLVDGWRTFLTPPGAIQEADPGLTNVNLKAGDNLPALLKERLDYMCFPKNGLESIAGIPRRLVPQYMRILPMNFSNLDLAFERIQSDHKGILAQIHWQFKYNTPSEAKMQEDFSLFDIPGSPAKINIAADLDIPSPGVFQWIYISRPGTYSFFYGGDIALDVSFYFDNNISTAVSPYNNVSIGSLGLNEEKLKNLWHEFRLSENGDQVDVHRPMFIKIKAAAANADATGRVSFSFIKHTGENRYLAIGLLANDSAKDPRLPVGQKNGENDECWFRCAVKEALLSGKPYPVQFYIKNDLKKKIKVNLYKSLSAKTSFGRATTGDKLCLIEKERTGGMEEVYMLLKRSEVTDYEFLAGYRYALSYINHLEIYSIDDQSGLGADEIHLTITADEMTAPFLDFIDEDFDDDERRMLNSYCPKNVAFEKQLSLTVYELDGGDDDDGPFYGSIPALAKGENERDSSIIVEAEGAIYQVLYRLSRQPNV